jgi:hypothetical protein
MTSTSILAQSQLEFAPIGAEWYYTNPGESEELLGRYLHYTSTRDTLVNGKQARVIESECAPFLVVHEDNGRVYYLFNDKFRLIYDFSAAVGDTVVFEFMAPKPDSYIYDTTYHVAYRVDSITSIDAEGGSIRKFAAVAVEVDSLDYNQLSGFLWNTNYHYLERVGYSNGFIVRLELPGPAIGLPDYLRCYNDSDLAYQTDWWAMQSKPCDYNLQTSIMEVRTPFELNVYPNPCYSSISINHNGTLDSGLHSVKLHSPTGVQLLSQKLNKTKLNLDVSHLPPGLYLITVYGSNGFISKPKKIIKL